MRNLGPASLFFEMLELGNTSEAAMKLMTLFVGCMLASTAALADEVTTTTTHRTQEPGTGVYVGVPGVAGVRVGSPPHGCTTQHRTTTDTDTGDSKSATRSNC
jgi:hypothetical protein